MIAAQSFLSMERFFVLTNHIGVACLEGATSVFMHDDQLAPVFIAADCIFVQPCSPLWSCPTYRQDQQECL